MGPGCLQHIRLPLFFQDRPFLKYALGCYVEWWEITHRGNPNRGRQVLDLVVSLINGLGRFRVAGVAAALAVAATGVSSIPAEAVQRAPAKIDGFGPYTIGMPLADARKADPNAEESACGEIAEDRTCLVVKAAVFEEPAVIYAVLDEKRTKVDKIVAKLDPRLSRRRAFRCIRLSEKVFALLVVVYGSKYKQQYDADRRPLPAVAWDGELEGRLIFRANCKSQDEGMPMITVVPRKGEGSSVAADLSPSPSPAQRSDDPAALLQGQNPGGSPAARSDAVSALAESAKRVEQQIRSTQPVPQESVTGQGRRSAPVVFDGIPGDLSIDSPISDPKPAPSVPQIAIEDPSILPRAAPRTPVSVTLLPDATPKPADPAPVSEAAPAKAAPASQLTTENAPKPIPTPTTPTTATAAVPTPPQAAPAAEKPVDVARLSPAPSALPSSAPSSSPPPQPGAAAPTAGTVPAATPEPDQDILVDADDDEGEQIEPVREMPVFAQTGTSTSLASAAVQSHRSEAAGVRSSSAPSSFATPADAARIPPRDPAAQVASAPIPKSPTAPQSSTGQPRSLLAARDAARSAADPTPTTEVLPALDDEPTGTVSVSAERVAEPSSARPQAAVPEPNPAQATVPAPGPTQPAATPAQGEQRMASGQPLRLTRDADALPYRARLEPPPPAVDVDRQPIPSAAAPPPATVTDGQSAKTARRPVPPEPESRKTAEGIEDFGSQLDLRIDRQRRHWKAPVPAVRPWRVFGTSSLNGGSVAYDVADAIVLDEPRLPAGAENGSPESAAATKPLNVRESLPTKAPVPPRRPWNTLRDAVAVKHVTPPPVPSKRPSVEATARQQPEETLAVQTDGSTPELGSSATNAATADSESLSRGADTIDYF